MDADKMIHDNLDWVFALQDYRDEAEIELENKNKEIEDLKKEILNQTGKKLFGLFGYEIWLTTIQHKEQQQ